MDLAPSKPPSAPAERPLDLSLPRNPSTAESVAAMVRNDARSHTARLNGWERQALTLGTVPCFIETTAPNGDRITAVGRLVAQPRLFSDATNDRRPIAVCAPP